jgi:hypothetical protein
MIGLQSRKKILLIFGTAVVALLVSTTSQMRMVSASVEGGVPGSNTSNSNQGAAEGCSPIDPRCGLEDQQNNADVSCEEDPMCGQAVNHINQAQSALENGDTEGAKMHMDAAKRALGCNKIIDPNC